MRSYLLIESRCEPETDDVGALFDLAGQLVDAGHPVTLFLVQNAVLAGQYSQRLAVLMDRGVQGWADEYSMQARGVGPDRLPPRLQVGGPTQLVRLLMTPGIVPVWH